MLLFILFKSEKRSLLPLLAAGFALFSASLLVRCIWKHIRVHAVLRFETMEDQTNLHRNKQPRFSSDTRPDLVTMAAPSPFALELGVCPQGARKPAFTFQQWQELQHQALIYKYMAASLPVPVHLVLPIWKSVAAASSSLYGPHRYPTFMMRSTGRWCTEYRNNIMDAEPGRCRRTDGKKWRCSRDVVPEQKYCERHMHRGRNRSRKPVEPASKPVVIATATPTAISNSSSRSSSSNVSSPKVWFSPNSVLHSSAATRDERP